MIVAAAIRIDGVTYALPAPARHHDVIRRFSHLGILGAEQGFIDSNAGFVSRFRARKIAEESNQLLEVSSTGPHLFSEDVW